MAEIVDRDSLQNIFLDSVTFTVSLFVTELASGEEVVGIDARLGVLVGSLAGAVIGAVVLAPGRTDRSMGDHTPARTEPPLGPSSAP